MALAALRAGQVEPGERPTGGGVIELPVCPQHRVVAEVARGWETGCHMVHGVRRGGVIVHVTRGANCVCAGQVVVIVDMALTALRAGQVEPGQRPTGSGVIEFAVGPEHRVVTVLARGWETQLEVVNGSGGRVVVVLVAADASRVRAGQVVVVVDVALAALHGGVRAGQRES